MPEWLKIGGAVFLTIILVFIGIGVYNFIVQENQLNADLADVETRLTSAQTNAQNLQQESQYLANPLNLEKELRARFNFKKPGETMIIIVPEQSSTASSTE